MMAAGATEAGSMRVTEPSAASDTTEDTGGRIFGEVGAIRGEIGSAAAALDAALAAADGREFSSSSDAGRSSSSGSGPPDPDALTARIISTSNQLEDEPWLPVRNIVTMYRIACTAGAEKQWEVLRRYSDFAELHLRLGKEGMVDLLGKQEKDSNSNSNSTENGKDVKDDESAKEKVREPDLALFVLSLCFLTNITHFLWMIISYRSVSRVLTY